MWLAPRKMVEEREGDSGEKADKMESDQVDQETLQARRQGIKNAEERVKDPNASSSGDGTEDGNTEVNKEPMTDNELQDQKITDWLHENAGV